MKLRILPGKGKVPQKKMGLKGGLRKTLLFKTGIILLLFIIPVISPRLHAEMVLTPQEDIMLAEALHRLSQKYEVFFSYDETTIRNVEVSYQPEKYNNVEHALDQLLEGTTLKYKVFDNRYIILYEESKEAISSLKGMVRHLNTVIDSQEKADPVRKRERSVALLKRSITKQVEPLAFFVSGKVTDEAGEPLIGVNIQVKGTNTGTATDFEGSFTLEDIDENAVLVVSYVGYRTLEVSVAGKSSLAITMVSDSQLLDEVVVTAMGITREKKSLGYSVQQVSGKDISVSKSVDVSSMLAGKVAGLQLAGSPSSSFDNSDIIVRGINGLNPGFPLFVVDGTPTDQANVIMDNVESISVLKGAAATALYGNRAANGVVMITSKKGKRNAAPSIELNLAGSFENLYILPPYQNEYAGGYASSAKSPGTRYDKEGFEIFKYNPARHPAEWASFDGQRMIEYGADESWGPKINGQEYRPYYSWYPGEEFGKLEKLTAHPDNTKDFFRTGRSLNNSIAVSGGGEKYNYRLTYANQNRNLIYPGSNRNQNQIGINSSYDLNKNITVMTDLAYTTNKTKGKPFEKTRNYDGLSLFMNMNQWFQRHLDMNRLKNYRNADGSFRTWNIGNPNSSGDPDVYLQPQYWDSPYFIVNEAFSTERTDRLVGNLGFDYRFNDVFSLTAYGRMNTLHGQGDFRRTTGGIQQDKYSINYSKTTEMNYEANLNFKKRFGDYSLNGFVGGNIRKNKYEMLENETQGGLIFPNNFAIAASTARPETFQAFSVKNVNSLYGKASLGYKSFLFVDATLRNDWSSALPNNDNSYIYPSLSGSFVFSEFMRQSGIKDVLSFGKIRASYAQVGSDLDFNQVNINVIRGSHYGNNPSTEIGNEFRSGAIRPALTKSWEIGGEFGFFYTFGVDISYYKDNNIDQIISIPVASSSGYNTAQINAGNIQRKGLELSISASPFKGNENGFSWNTALNFAKSESFIKSLAPGIDQQVFLKHATGRYIVNRVGEKWGTIITRLVKKDDQGRTVFRSANGSLAVTENNAIGSILPDFTGGWFNSFSFKGIDLAFSFDFQKGGRYYSGTITQYVKTGQAKQTVGVNDKGNDIRSFPSEGGGVRIEGVYNDVPTTVYVTAKKYFSDLIHADGYSNTLDASYIKLREIRLGYSIPTKLYENTGVKNINIGIIANNVWIASKSVRDLGIDPSELESFGEERGQLGATRRIGLNLRVVL